ncbi:uncharacterized protein [Glycine max]|uniref:uncharacterized protein n=1 Tax=Glycine max TaxID=3847 RepID=UPI001B354B85|nr:uncharacterized protein LOC106794312 [Glycine max]
MSGVCAEQHKFYPSHQLLSPKKTLREIDIPPRKLLTRRAAKCVGGTDVYSEETMQQKFLPSNDSDEDDPYSSDHFRMFEFKVRQCTRSRSHDWTDCPLANFPQQCMAPVEMAPSTGKSHVACRHCDWRQRTAYRRSYWRIQRCMEALLEGATSGGDLGEREAPVMLAFSASVGFKRRWLKGRLQFTVACKICVLKVKKKVVAVEREDQWHLRRHAHRAYKLGLVQLMVTSCGCNPSMFQNMFGMGNQIENYILDEQCRHIKVKNKYQRKLFLYFGNFVWEPYTPTVMAALPQICVVGSVVWFAVVPLICFHVVEWHQPDRVLRQYGLQQPIPGCPSQPQNLHGITLKGKQDENWFHLLAPIISQWNNAAQFRVDVYPRQQGLLGFNSDYMLAIISEEQERVTEPVSHGPASEREFPAPEFHILQSSVETRGLGRRREPVQAEQYSQQMMERGHGMYYTPATFSEYPSQILPEYRHAGCSRDDACQYALGVFECWLHPSWYRTEACKDGRNCKRKVCFFAHTPRQLRILPVTSSPSSNDMPCKKNLKQVLNHASKTNNNNNCCLFCHCGASSSASPTSTLFGMSHFSPPLSPSSSSSPPPSPLKPRNAVSPISRYSAVNVNPHHVVSYKDVFTELVNSLERLSFNEGSPVSGAKAPNFPWLDVSLNCEEQQQQQQNPFIVPSFGCEDQQQQNQFIFSPPSIQTPTNGKFCSNRFMGNDNNNKVVGGADVNGPDLAWVNELLM